MAKMQLVDPCCSLANSHLWSAGRVLPEHVWAADDGGWGLGALGKRTLTWSHGLQRGQARIWHSFSPHYQLLWKSAVARRDPVPCRDKLTHALIVNCLCLYWKSLILLWKARHFSRIALQLISYVMLPGMKKEENKAEEDTRLNKHCI